MRKKVLIFLCVTLLALAANFIAYPFTMVGGDDGRNVQDALRISHGEVPIADYTTRAPILLWLIHISAKAFGRSLLIFKLPMLIGSALTAGLLFLLGMELFYEKVGILSGIIHALIPYSLWVGAVIRNETLMMVFLLIASVLLVKWTKKKKSLYIILSGIFIGLAYIERHSALFFIAVTGSIVFIDIFIKKSVQTVTEKLRYITTQTLLLATGIMIGFLPIFLFVAYFNFQNAVELWLSPFLLNTVQGVRDVHNVTAWRDIYDFFRNWGLTLTESFAVQLGLLFAGLIVFSIVSIQTINKKYKLVRRYSIGVVFVVLYGTFLVHSINIIRIGYFKPYLFFSLLVFLSTFLFIVLRYTVVTSSLKYILLKYSLSHWFLVLWVAWFIFGYSITLPGYTREIIPPLVIFSSLILVAIPWSSMPRYLSAFLIISILGFWCVGIIWFQDPRTGGWWWRQGTINEVAWFLKSHTAPGDEILSANALPVILASRRVTMDINSYSMIFANGADNSWGTYPSPNRVFRYIQQKPPVYVLVDGRMINHFFDPYPFFSEFVADNYKLVAKFGSNKRKDWIQVWKLND